MLQAPQASARTTLGQATAIAKSAGTTDLTTPTLLARAPEATAISTRTRRALLRVNPPPGRATLPGVGALGRAHSKLDPIFARRAVNDERLRLAEIAHESALLDEHRRTETRLLLRAARGSWSPDVWIPGGVPARRHVFDALTDHGRVLVVGSRWSGKSALAAYVLVRTARADARFRDHIPFGVQVSRMSVPALEEAEIARLNPAAGADVLQMALESGQALVVVDGLDESTSPGDLKRSITTFARRHPQCSLMVTTRPLPAKVPGRSESALDGFLPVRMAGPDARRGATVHDLDAFRSPAERVSRLGDDVRSLLEAWRFDALPRGGALRRLTERGRFILACHLAAGTYDGRMIELSSEQLEQDIREELTKARWFEDTGQLLHAEESPSGGEPLPDPAAFARDAVEDIRACPGVLVEKQPGLFAFADLAVQQYLTAMFFAKEGFFTQLGLVRDDPWFHPVIVMCAGLPAPFSSAMPARSLIGELLDAGVAADSAMTFLAARASEVAPALPRPLRDEIDRRMRSALPPRSSVQVAHFVDGVGELAAPALLASLEGAGPNERAFVVTALGRLDHPPALRALARLATDEEPTTEKVLCWFWNVDAVIHGEPVGFFAFAAIFNLALSSTAANTMLDQVLGRVSLRTLETFMRVVALKIMEDEHWGAEPEPERDPDHAGVLMTKVITAYSRRSPR